MSPSVSELRSTSQIAAIVFGSVGGTLLGWAVAAYTFIPLAEFLYASFQPSAVSNPATWLIAFFGGAMLLGGIVGAFAGVATARGLKSWSEASDRFVEESRQDPNQVKNK